MFHSSIQAFSAAAAVSQTVRDRSTEGARPMHRGLSKRELQRLRRLSCLCDMFAMVDSRDLHRAAGNA